ncbi:hypothetical protein [Marinomonas sp. 2405UD68-3]|uniref:hypothetical protein n=1 Tax=Marinomonas sp. 2405UD68-3 TaxID=3391835 RepID=UPI0039C9906C
MAQAQHSVHGVFHKGYDELHIEASAELGDRSVLAFRGGNGEAEINPERDVELGVAQDGEVRWEHWPRATLKYCRQKNRLKFDRMKLHWLGVQHDEFGGLAMLGTMASVLRLVTKKSREECIHVAELYWYGRHKKCLNSKKRTISIEKHELYFV